MTVLLFCVHLSRFLLNLQTHFVLGTGCTLKPCDGLLWSSEILGFIVFLCNCLTIELASLELSFSLNDRLTDLALTPANDKPLMSLQVGLSWPCSDCYCDLCECAMSVFFYIVQIGINNCKLYRIYCIIDLLISHHVHTS